MNGILKLYEQAKGHLDDHDAKGALPSAEEAYRVLRMFIDELNLKWSPPDDTPRAPEEKPERIKLQEQPQEPKMEKERIESRLREIEQQIDLLARQQDSLKNDAAKVLQQNQEAKATGQSAQKAQAATKGSQGKGQKAAQASQQQGGSPGSSESGDKSQQSRDGQGGQSDDQHGQQSSAGRQGQSGTSQSGQAQGEQGSKSTSGQGSQPGRAQNGQPGQGQGRQSQGQQSSKSAGGQDGQAGNGQGRQPGSGRSDRSGPGQSPEGQPSSDSGEEPGWASAQTDTRMRMIQARQKALREQAAGLSEQVGELSASEPSPSGGASQQAKEHLDEAVETMKRFEERIADARYEAADSVRAADIADLADSASRRLAEAGRAIQLGLSDQGRSSSDKAREMAEQLAQDAQAYDESLSEADKLAMQNRLKAAKRLLESMAGAHQSPVSRGGGPGAGHVYTTDPHTSAADTARLLARQFWSMALEAKKRRSRPVEEDARDVEFFEEENQFFEQAARFGSGGAGR
jgi:hypothetical protein